MTNNTRYIEHDGQRWYQDGTKDWYLLEGAKQLGHTRAWFEYKQQQEQQ